MIMEIKCPLCDKLLLTLEKNDISQVDIDNHLQMVACDCGNQNNSAEIIQEENFMSENAKEYIQNFAPTSKPFTIWSLFKSPIFWLFIVALFFGLKAFAEDYTQQVFNITSSSEKVLNPNALRKGLRIDNHSAHDIYLKYGSSHIATEGVHIIKNSSYEPIHVPVGSVYLKSSDGSVDISVTEVIK